MELTLKVWTYIGYFVNFESLCHGGRDVEWGNGFVCLPNHVFQSLQNVSKQF